MCKIIPKIKRETYRKRRRRRRATPQKRPAEKSQQVSGQQKINTIKTKKKLTKKIEKKRWSVGRPSGRGGAGGAVACRDATAPASCRSRRTCRPGSSGASLEWMQIFTVMKRRLSSSSFVVDVIFRRRRSLLSAFVVVVFRRRHSKETKGTNGSGGA